MKEGKGIPKELPGIPVEDLDQLKQRVDNIIRDGLSPRIYGYDIQPVPLQNGNCAVVLRIRRSFNPPHMVTIGGHRRFYGRTSSGTITLDVEELRRLFLLGATTAERVRDFRAERLARIHAEETPVPLLKGPKCVLHIVPFDSLDSGTNYDLSTFKNAPNNLPNIQWPVSDGRYNFDGFVSHYNYVGPNDPEPTWSYTQCFRNGVLEAVYMEYGPNVDGNVHRVLNLDYQTYVPDSLKQFLTLQDQLGASPPVFVMLSFLAIRGCPLARIEEHGHVHTISPLPIDRDDLVLPEVVLDGFDCDVQQTMRCVFDIVLNAFGLTREDLG
jgi:hypothetical protein